MYDKYQGIEEPDEAKVSRPVLKSSGVGDCFTDFNSRRLTEGKKQLNVLLVRNVPLNNFKGDPANRRDKIGVCP
jgi:hypothetical protein